MRHTRIPRIRSNIHRHTSSHKSLLGSESERDGDQYNVTKVETGTIIGILTLSAGLYRDATTGRE